jgi:hypothetical protein
VERQAFVLSIGQELPVAQPVLLRAVCHPLIELE